MHPRLTLSSACRWIAASTIALALSSAATAQLTLSLEPPNPGPGDPVDIVLKGGEEGDYTLVLVALDPGPTVFPFIGSLEVGLDTLTLYTLGQFDETGCVRFACALNCFAADVDPFYLQAVTVRLTPGGPTIPEKSNPVILAIDDFKITDCNNNGIDDDCDIESGTSNDCNANDIPDECEDDCNGNGVPDDCDILNGTSTDGNGDGIPDECEDCCANGKPISLTLLYTGEDCSASNHAQDPSSASCSGDPASAATVHVLVTDKKNLNNAKIWFDGNVDLGTSFDMTAGSANTLSSNIWIRVSDLSGNVLQTIQFHASCSQPLFLGNQFGSMLLTGCISN